MNTKQQLTNILYGLDKYGYCLNSEIEDAQKQIVTLLRESYLWGMDNIDVDGCRIDDPDDDFKNFLNFEQK